MTEERLKEIKDSIDLQEKIANAYCSGEVLIVLNEERELYNEVVRLREIIKHYEETQTFGDYVKEVNLLVDYKSRIDKAIEYIENKPLYETIYDYNIEDEQELQYVSDETASNDLLNILRGNNDI